MEVELVLLALPFAIHQTFSEVEARGAVKQVRAIAMVVFEIPQAGYGACLVS